VLLWWPLPFVSRSRTVALIFPAVEADNEEESEKKKTRELRCTQPTHAVASDQREEWEEGAAILPPSPTNVWWS
jgi:hypothetical protein